MGNTNNDPGDWGEEANSHQKSGKEIFGTSWNDAITTLFEVEQILGEGGMGKVYLLRNKHTGIRFAVKRPRGLAGNERGNERRKFLNELLVWSDLPEHPNLVPCHTFEIVGDDILIFAEYMKGGDLKKLIDNGDLYRGGKEQALERILDTAIQFAWGLHCIHELGLLHCDVKPANVLLSHNAEASVHGLKASVTDYGATANKNFLTRSYCSPEQADGGKLDKGTDRWSWGVSVLEMFYGSTPGPEGPKAAEYLEAFLKNNDTRPGIPSMPSGVETILRDCFLADRAKKDSSMKVVVDKLKDIYRLEIHQEYNRTLTSIVRGPDLLSDVDERRMYQGTTWEDPKVWLERALKAGGADITEAANILPPRGKSRRGELVADIIGYDEARILYERRILYEQLINSGKYNLDYQLARLCRQAALVHLTAGSPSGALALYDQAIDILERLASLKKEDPYVVVNSLCVTYQEKADTLTSLHAYQAALTLYDQVIKIREWLVNVVSRDELADSLALSYENKAGLLADQTKYKDAVFLYDQAIMILERLVNVEHRDELADRLASAYQNKAGALNGLDDYQGAVILCDQAIKILERLVNVEHRGELAHNLAIVYLNTANALTILDKFSAAVSYSDQAINLLKRLVNIEHRDELREVLADAYSNKASALDESHNYQAAVACSDHAIEILEQLVYVELRDELFDNLAMAYRNKAHALEGLPDYQAAAACSEQAIEILERLVNIKHRDELADRLALVYENKAGELENLNDYSGAVLSYDQAIKIFEQLVNIEHRGDLANDLERVLNKREAAIKHLKDH